MSVTAINEFSAGLLPLLWKASWQGGLALLLLILISRAASRIRASSSNSSSTVAPRVVSGASS